MAALEAISARIRGRVQGVGFRLAARGAADRLGVCGWVRNRSDGSVEVAAEGAPAAVATFVAWCRHGPAGARVDAVDVRATEPSGATAFEIR